MFCSGSRFENVRAGPASYVVFGARKLTSKRSRSGNAVRSQRCMLHIPIIACSLTWSKIRAVPPPGFTDDDEE